MRSFLLPLVAALTLCSLACAALAADDTSRFDVARTFADALVETHQAEEQAKRDVAAIPMGPEQAQFILMAMVRNCTRTKMKLNVMIQRLRQIHIADPQFSTLVPYLADNYARKAELYDEMVEAAKTLLEGPKEGANYGKLAAHMPEVTAQVEFVDETIFKISPMIGLLLVSRKPDRKNHLSRLSITRQQARELTTKLQQGFGRALDAKEPNWTTSSASLLRTFLHDKGYKYADDPWL
jgi:hypothetical protein